MSVIIRLDNLSWNASSLDVRRYFYGLDIPDGGVHIAGGERGTVFIAFATDEDARQAMLKDHGRICNEPFRLFLSSKTEMQNVIASARGASGPIHEVFLGKSFESNVGGPMAQSEGQRGFKSFGEEGEQNRKNSQSFSLLRPGRQSTLARPYPDTFSERQRLERSVAFEEDNYPKDPQHTGSQGRGRPPFDDGSSRNEGARDQWDNEHKTESEAGFQRPDSERFGDCLGDRGQDRREVEVRQGNFGNRREQTSRDGPRPSQIDFEQNRSLNFRDDARFPPSKGEFYGSSGRRSQDRRPFDMGYFENVRSDQWSDNYPQDTDRRPFGSKGQSYLEQKGNEQGLGSRNEAHGDWCVHVYNLPQTFNYREIRRFFSKSIIPQDGLKLINDRNGQRTGKCYIRLANEKGFRAALDCNNTLLSGKTVFVERTSAQEFDDAWDSYLPLDNRSRSRSPIERNVKGKLYYVAVRNLPYKCSEDDLMKWLGNPPLSSDSGPYFGYDGAGNKIGKAFLRLNSFPDFKAALGCNQKDWHGQNVQVKAIGERIFHDRRSIARKWNVSGQKEKNVDKGLSEDFTGPRNPTAAKDEEKKFYCVRILGLPFTANPQSIKEFFKGLEIANGGIHIIYNHDNQAAGFGFVEFVTSTDCRRALERNNQFMGKRYLVLEPVAKDDVLFEFNNLQNEYGGMRRDGSGDSGSRGCGPDTGASETVVRMKNLHFKVQLEDILHLFRGHHPIMESIKLQYRDGRPTGDGLISFASFAEAERAVKELNHQKLLGWPLTMTLI